MRSAFFLLTLLPPLWAFASFAQSTPGVASQDLPPPEEAPAEYNMITLQGLNKVTGHISRLEEIVGTTMRFGTLEIVARRCWKSNPEERPENAALLEISELKPGEAPARIFLGWMFSSSPGLSGLEHPVYDITVLSCDYSKDPEKEDSKEEKAPPSSEKKTSPSRG